jgi:hypothetical protein
MKSHKEQENKSIAEASLRTVTLTDGTVVVCHSAKGKHVRQAQRLMDGDETLMIPSLICICADFGGRKMTIEELDERPAKDMLLLIAEYSETSF